MLPMCLRGCKHSYTPVEALLVVEPDEPTYAVTCLVDVAKATGWIDEFLLDDTVDAFCNSVVRRIIVFRHAYQCATGFQFEHVSIGTILDAPVGVMYQPGQVVTSLSYSLHQGLHRVTGLQAFRETPAYNLVRVGVCDQMQIAAVFFNFNIGYITDPQSI